MKKKLILAGVVVAALCLPQFTSCSDDNDDDNEQQPVSSDSTSSSKSDSTDISKTDSTDSLKTDSVVPFVDSMTVSGTIGNYSYVDLGLKSGLKWATYNVGATSTTECGEYYSWGVGDGKALLGSLYWGYEIYLYKYNTDSVYAYVNDQYLGDVDYKTVLDAEDDAATKNWGDSWRMPTKEEQEELIDGCTWQWIDNYGGTGVSGQMGTSKANGNTIFLPAAGYSWWQGAGYHTYGEYEGKKEICSQGFYWTSSLNEAHPQSAYGCSFDSSDVKITSFARVYEYNYSVSYSVRAVSK